MATIKEKIKTLRFEFDMKIKDIAEEIGVTKSAAYKYSSGQRLKPDQEIEDKTDALIERLRKSGINYYRLKNSRSSK